MFKPTTIILYICEYDTRKGHNHRLQLFESEYPSSESEYPSSFFANHCPKIGMPLMAAHLNSERISWLKGVGAMSIGSQD